MTALQAAGLIRRRKISSVELTRGCLDAIARKNPEINAYITVLEEQALARARDMDGELAGAGSPRSVWHGVPVALKDVFCTRAVRTTAGSRVYADYVPAYDAAVVERLYEAGAVLLGKTNMHELAYGITSENPHFGPVRNPWNPGHVAGGSSGGSGAVIPAGMALMALGSDTGGSIRIPASFCGCVGLKPTSGRVSRFGVVPLDFTLDHIGPLAATVRDAASALQLIAGHDSRDDSSSRAFVDRYVPGEDADVRGLRLGVPETFFFDRLAPDVEAAVRDVIGKAGALGMRVVPVAMPDMEAITTLGRLILLAEAAAAMTPALDKRDLFGPDVLALLDQGRLISAADYINAQRLRRIYQRKFDAVWEAADVLLAPTTACTAPRLGQAEVSVGGVTEDVRLAATRLSRCFNVLGLPALSMPCGRSGEGLPVGLQLVARSFNERTLLLVAAALEAAIAFKVNP
jgi:aspartyl-tRNA(Asn)/glutamyl-tRNA(Gln) amidotransferase subunit A